MGQVSTVGCFSSSQANWASCAKGQAIHLGEERGNGAQVFVMSQRWVNNTCPLQMVIPLIFCHIQWAFTDGTLLKLTPSALPDRNDYPHLTDEETDVKEGKLGQRSHS